MCSWQAALIPWQQQFPGSSAASIAGGAMGELLLTHSPEHPCCPGRVPSPDRPQHQGIQAASDTGASVGMLTNSLCRILELFGAFI